MLELLLVFSLIYRLHSYSLLSGVSFHAASVLYSLRIPHDFYVHFAEYLHQPFPDSYSVHMLYTIHWLHALASLFHDPYSNSSAMHTHHIVHLFLLSCSWMMHYTPVGAMVMFIHDLPDVLMFLMRHYERSKSAKKFVLYVPTVAAWIYYRIYVFHHLIHSIYGITPLTRGILVCLLALRALWAVNCFWLFQLIRRGYRAFKPSY